MAKLSYRRVKRSDPYTFDHSGRLKFLHDLADGKAERTSEAGRWQLHVGNYQGSTYGAAVAFDRKGGGKSVLYTRLVDGKSSPINGAGAESPTQTARKALELSMRNHAGLDTTSKASPDSKRRKATLKQL